MRPTGLSRGESPLQRGGAPAPAVSEADEIGPMRVSPLAGVLRQAGARIIRAYGVEVALDFGSTPGELAVCQRAVGVADRSELVKLELRGSREPMAAALEGLGCRGATAGSMVAGSFGWLCVLDPLHVLLLCEPADGVLLEQRLRRLGDASPELSSGDVSADYAAIAVVGPRAGDLLRAVGPTDGSAVPPLDRLRAVGIAGRSAFVLRLGEGRFLVITAAGRAEDTWHALHDAGEGLGVGSVGHAALDRFEISARLAARRSAH